MTWSKPEFVEITLCMEVTAYVNTDDKVAGAVRRKEEESEPRPATERESAAVGR